MRINSLALSPNFGKVLKANATFSDTQMSIAKDIKDKMNTVYDGHFKGQTPNNWLEDRKCDTLVLPGSSDKSVKLCVTSRATDDPAKRPTVKQYYVVGEYSKEIPFYPNDIKEADKNRWGTVALSALALVAYILAVCLAAKVDNVNASKEKMVQGKEAIVDSLKTVVKNDTITTFRVK